MDTLDPDTPTDDQIIEMAFEGAFLDVFGPWLPPSRGSARPTTQEGGGEGEGDEAGEVVAS